jgi:site-specific DNA-methyltransferase (adenine-specific)
MFKVGQYDIQCANVLDWASEYTGPKFHAILCDPPYEMSFMGKSWDSSGIAFQSIVWATLAAHLHSGGFLMAFGGSRTYHRLAVAVEDAGLIIHPAMTWLNGQGFPKATRIDTQIDKVAGAKRQVIGTQTPLAAAWEGHRYGLQALKPAAEFILIAQKPYEDKPVECIVETGAGALWIDGARVGTNGGETHQGRWPANVCLLHSPGCVRIGTRRVRGTGVAVGEKASSIYGTQFDDKGDGQRTYADPDGLETVDKWQCVPDCPARLLGEQSGEGKSPPSYIRNADGKGKTSYTHGQSAGEFSRNFGDTGTAARFFQNIDWQYEISEQIAIAPAFRYQSKVSSGERNLGLDAFYWRKDKKAPTGFVQISREEWEQLDGKVRGRGNIHPTQKPIALCKHLATLLLPPAEYAPRRILVPFSGMCSEVIGATLAGFEMIQGVDIEPDYCRAGIARLGAWSHYAEAGYSDIKSILKLAKKAIKKIFGGS